MLDNSPNDMDWLYLQLIPFASINPNDNYKCVTKQSKSTAKDLAATIKGNHAELLSPVAVFKNEYIYDNVKNKKEFIVSLGIFDLDPSSAIITVTKNNNLEVTWTERAGKGKFSSKIPSYLVATSAPVLSYEGGVLNISVPVKSRNEDETVFIGKLESK
jgi:acetylglutamate synthase